MKSYLLDVVIASDLERTRSTPSDHNLCIEDVQSNAIVGLPVTYGFNDELRMGTIAESIICGRRWAVQIKLDICKTDHLPVGAAKMHLLAEIRKNIKAKQVTCNYQLLHDENSDNANITQIRVKSFAFVNCSAFTGAEIVSIQSV